jgi:hypothetical protein
MKKEYYEDLQKQIDLWIALQDKILDKHIPTLHCSKRRK